MKIFQVIQRPQPRGVEIFTAQLCESLSQNGHEVMLISLFSGDYSLAFAGPQIHLGLDPSRRFWDWKAWKAFSDLVQTEKPDIIQANAADTLKFAVFSKLLGEWNVPIIFRNASMISQYILGFGKKKFNRFLWNRVDGVVSVCEASQKDMQALFSLSKPRLKVIPIGFEIEKLRGLALKEGEIELVHIGGFTFEKNHLELLAIFQTLVNTYPKLKLKLIGTGPLEETIREEIKQSGLEENVEMLGSLAQPFRELSTHSILVLPSKIEGLPAVILEAMALKIPVIAYGVGGIPEIVQTGKTGWCIPPGDKLGFIQAIQEVSNLDPNTKGRILENAFAMVREGFTLEKVTQQFEEFYQSILHS